MLKTVWALKYRPTDIKNYIYQNETHRELITKFIADQSIPNLMFLGTPGTGKTTLALILKNALGVDDCDFLKINASMETSVDTVRNKISSFASTIPTGAFKLIFLDEADRLSAHAQDALRVPTEDPILSMNVRFIIAGNNGHRIEPAIRSRFTELTFSKIDRDQVLERSAEILVKEKVKFSSIEQLEKYVDMAYPDFRKLLVLLEQNSKTGKLAEEPVVSTSTQDSQIAVMDHLERNEWQAIRAVVAGFDTPEDWIDMYKFMYRYINEVGKFKDHIKWKQAIVVIADFLYRHGLVADPEINFMACIIKLTEI